MSSPASISQRLATTSSLLLERSRILDLGMKPSPSSTQQVVRNLTSIRADLERLDALSPGLGGGGKGKGRGEGGEEGVEELRGRYDRLVEMLERDDVGREKAKALKRAPSAQANIPCRPSPSPSPVQSPFHDPVSPASEDIPSFSIEPPTPAIGQKPFRDYPSDDEGEPEPDRTLSPHEMLSNQQMMMDDQDERLNLLSSSIGRQSTLSTQIGSELDLHHELIEDTDHAMDRTAASLGRARRRMDRVADEAKQHGAPDC
ncbi:hypothetical protein I350_07184 [Cryptococcus amylolentus CBS 6273]|uniref:t-SNARE coiled-coil homology domain-containing protein n=1 Tax=Cryptococcus amylolentus CBS 6273 TaxID=1296118 RepID=A0A1E3JDY3_9TREE|nr:hypothetical protein I350_07184 [Cryptococcus amylolentus CBS 6273]